MVTVIWFAASVPTIGTGAAQVTVGMLIKQVTVTVGMLIRQVTVGMVTEVGTGTRF